MLCTANYTWSNVPGNSLMVTVKTGNVVLYTGTPDSGVPFVNTNSTLSIDRAYTLTFEISDELNSTSVNYLVQSSNIFLRLSPKTNAIGIGTYPQGDKRVEIDDEWGLYLHGQEVDERYLPTHSPVANENLTIKRYDYGSDNYQTGTFWGPYLFFDDKSGDKEFHLYDGTVEKEFEPKF